MVVKIQMQIVRKDTPYESFRITLPRAIVQAHNLRDKDFNLEIEGKKIVLTPVSTEEKKK